MKRANKTTEKTRDLKSLISKLAEHEILVTKELGYIRGGEGDGGGVIIIIPPKPV